MKVYRVLIYNGDENWIKTTLKHNAVKGIAEFYNGTITSLYIKNNEENIEELLEGEKDNDEC